MSIVISQPMLLPWVGMLEQVVLTDIFANYADMQFSRGSLTSRVQIEDHTEPRQLAVPPERFHLSEHVDQVRLCTNTGQRDQYLCKLEQTYEEMPYAQNMLTFMRTMYEVGYIHMGTLALASMQAICGYLNIPPSTKLHDSMKLTVLGHNNDHVLTIVWQLYGGRYIAGHGAKNYLAHTEFEQHGTTVKYMNYAILPYRQLHGAFTPFVNSLDLIANHDPASKQYLNPQTFNWHQFIHE